MQWYFFQDTDVIYVIPRRDSNGSGGRKEMATTSGAHRDEDLLTWIYDVEKVIWEAQVFQRFYLRGDIHWHVLAFDSEGSISSSEAVWMATQVCHVPVSWNSKIQHAILYLLLAFHSENSSVDQCYERWRADGFQWFSLTLTSIQTPVWGISGLSLFSGGDLGVPDE